MTKQRIAIYARVSTDDKEQDPENQLAQLRAWCKHGGNEIVREYVDYVSGTKGTKDRKEFAQLFEDASKRQFDLVLFWSLDRFSREGTAKTISHLQRLDASGVAFRSYTEEMLSTDNELVRDILIAVMSAFAKQEAIRISKRTKAGLERTRAKGTRLGRPPVPAAKIAEIKRLRAEEPGLSERKLAARVGLPRSTVKKWL